jgi:hypothetical protein
MLEYGIFRIMKNYIAVVIALIVVSFGFWGHFPINNTTSNTYGKSLPQISFSVFDKLNLLSSGDTGVRSKVFATFTQYREYARNRDIEGVKSLSHQTSEACNDPERVEDCNALMDNVYFFTRDFKEEDFKHVFHNDKQIVLMTDFQEITDAQAGSELVRSVLFFTRDADGSPKILGLKFCLPDEEHPEECFETNPAKRDMDNNGWWDQVEALFR